MEGYPADDANETWHVHGADYPNDKGWEWGISCDVCFKGRGFDLQTAPMVGTIPGGHNDTHGSSRYQFQKGFDKGLDGYKEARDEGLQPKATTVEAVEKARAEVKSQERAIKKLKLDRDDRAQLKTAAGVDV